MRTHADVLDTDIHTFLERHENKDLLRFVAVGSVDDGKSTLIGRLLVDTDAVYDDHLADATERGGTGVLDLARITDGLRAEREQGITIDVAYRYFTTPSRKFIIADTPGHIQYTRNMATGASTADLAIILIDARLGVLQQSRRHAFIASMLGIPHLVVAVNKMDLVDFDQEVFDAIHAEFKAFCAQLHFVDVTFLPISALMGDNVVHKSESTPWYTGGSMLDILQTADIRASRNLKSFRFPVQTVIRPHLDYRGFAAQIASGVVKKGDAVKVLPSGVVSRVKAIDTYDGELESAFAPQSVVLRLEDEVDVSRGSLLVHPHDLPRSAHAFDAMVVWMSDKELDPDKSYLLKHTTNYVGAYLGKVRYEVDLDTLDPINDAETLHLNGIGRVAVTCHRPLHFDAYDDNRSMGAFIVIDSMTNNTVAAGMICGDVVGGAGGVDEDPASDPRSGVSRSERAERLSQRGAIIWLGGEPGSGRAAVAFTLERRLFDLGFTAYVLDRAAPPEETARVAGHIADAGLLAICVADGDQAAAVSTLGEERLLQRELGGGPDVDAAVAAIVAELRERELVRD